MSNKSNKSNDGDDRDDIDDNNKSDTPPSISPNIIDFIFGNPLRLVQNLMQNYSNIFSFQILGSKHIVLKLLKSIQLCLKQKIKT